MNDLCLNCSKEHEYTVWGAECDCGNPNVVHQQKCTGCNNIIGQITDDDYCGPKKLYCHECMNSART